MHTSHQGQSSQQRSTSSLTTPSDQTTMKQVNSTCTKDNSSHYTLPDNKNTSSANATCINWTNSYFKTTTILQQPPPLPSMHFKTIQNSKLHSTTTTTTKSIIPVPHARKPDTNTYKTTSTCTRTLNTLSIYISTSFVTLFKSSHQLTSIHICSIRTRNKRCKQPQVKR